MYPKVEIDNHFENPFFIGTVEDNNDPTFNYRVKVRIAGMHLNTISTAQLPWAAKVDASFMGMDSSAISHSIPEIGSQVLVLAVGNDINSLVYLGCLYKKTDPTPNGNDYLNTYGIYTKNGEFIGIKKLENIFHMIWNGDLTLDVKGKIKIGASAIQSAVLGTDLETLLQSMIGTFNTHVHPGLGLTPPLTPMNFKKVTSEKITVE